MSALDRQLVKDVPREWRTIVFAMLTLILMTMLRTHS